MKCVASCNVPLQRLERSSLNLETVALSRRTSTARVISDRTLPNTSIITRSKASRPGVHCCGSSLNDSGSPSHDSESPLQIQQPSTFESRAAAFCGRITSLFPLWVIIAAGLALTFPPLFLPIAPHLTTGLALTMLGMVRFGSGIRDQGSHTCSQSDPCMTTAL